MKKQKTASTGEQKRKLILFPFWHVERAERILAEQERNGYRFVKARFGCLFTFHKSKPRETKYVFTYSFPKDYEPVLEWENVLKSEEYRANVVHEGHNYHIFRITMENVDLWDFYKARLRYIRKTLIKKASISAYFALSGAFVSLSNAGNVAQGLRLCFLFVFAGGLLALLSYLVGFCVTARKRKSLS